MAVVVVASFAAVTLSRSATASAACPNEELRAENNSSGLPDCRAYERVTPAYTEGQIPRFSYSESVAPSGERVFVQDYGVFAGAEDGENSFTALGNPYIMDRTDGGWTATALAQPASEFAASFSYRKLATPELNGFVFELSRRTTPTLYEYYVKSLDGPLIPMGPTARPGASASVLEKGEAIGVSDDLSHILSASGVTRWPGDTTLEGDKSLYEYTAGEAEPKLVGVRNHGKLNSNAEAEVISRCGTSSYIPVKEIENYELSASGEIAVFTEEACSESPGEPEVAEIYARVAQEKTLAISEPIIPSDQNCTAACAVARTEPKPATFAAATRDGRHIFFTTDQPLTDEDRDATTDLYEAQLAGSGAQAEVSKVIDLSVGGGDDPTQGEGAEVQGLVGYSRDGDRVYFVADGNLTGSPNSVDGRTPEEAEPAVGQPNLYLVEPATGVTTFVATLSPEDAVDWARGSQFYRQVTPDGRYLAFASYDALTEGGSVPGVQNLFEFDATTDSLTRVSVPDEGFTADITSVLGESRSIANDGAVFFSGWAALTPGATEDPTFQRKNVYEYRAGHVYLIAPGSTSQNTVPGESSTNLIGTGEDGKDVLFTTSDSLIPSDGNTVIDLYDARSGGGFSQPTASGCIGESCQGAAAANPKSATPGTAAFIGPQNPKPHKKKPHKKKPHKKKPHKKKPHKKKPHKKKPHKKKPHKKQLTVGRGDKKGGSR